MLRSFDISCTLNTFHYCQGKVEMSYSQQSRNVLF
jgi:hypothetical protein